MVKSLISWVVVGVLAYIWWWLGYGWDYLLNLPRGEWQTTWLLYTILALIVLRHTGAPAGTANVFEAVINRIKNIVPHLLGLTVSLLVGLTIWTLMQGGGFSTTEYIQAVIVAVGSAVTTAAWLGATEDASA